MNVRDHPYAIWRKSSRSAGSGQCVEVARLKQGKTGIRDSQDRRPQAPVLTLTSAQFSALISGIKRGQYDM